MKKSLAIAVVLILLTSLFTACAGPSVNPQTESSTTQESKTATLSNTTATTTSVEISTTDEAEQTEEEDPFKFYTLFPLTTKVTKNLQNSLYGAVVGQTSWAETERLLTKRKIEFDNSLPDSSILVGKYISFRFDDENILETILVYWYEYEEDLFRPEMVKIETDRGAKMGDSMERIVELYGDGYQVRDWQFIAIEYTNTEAYIVFNFCQDVDRDYLFAWSISSKRSFKGPPEG